MNVTGAGLTHVKDFHSDEMRVFRGGLRNVSLNHSALVYGTTNTVRNYHDKMSYERGFIQHSRSNSNQMINFHFMLGGFRTFVLERFFKQVWYRRNIRNFWFPVLLAYTGGSITMRVYDNNCYDTFYFSE